MQTALFHWNTESKQKKLHQYFWRAQ